MKSRLAWIVAAFSAYVAAWALPVHVDGVRLPEGLPGWEAFRLAASPVWPYQGTSFESFDTWYGAVLAALSAFTNFAMVAAVWVMWRRSARALKVLGWVCLVCFFINAYWWITDFEASLRDLRAGYWVWWCTFLVMSVSALRLSRQVAE